MPKKQLAEIELLVKADENQRHLEEKKLEVKIIEAKEEREHKWIYLIWSAGFVLIVVMYEVMNNLWKFVR